MSETWRRVAREVTPPMLARALSGQARHETRLVDGYESWDAAVDAAHGYDEAELLSHVVAATELVTSGAAAFERDGVTFEKLEYRWPVVGALLWQAARHNGHLRVLDFGGSLGSTFRQYQPLLTDLDVRWTVVEQPAFVSAASAYTTDQLTFHTTIASAIAVSVPTVVLFSSVLQYVPLPHAVLREAADCGAEAIIIDRTPMTSLDSDVPSLQVVPPALYEASYAAWLLSKTRLINDLPLWEVIDEFAGIEPPTTSKKGIEVRWDGMILARQRP